MPLATCPTHRDFPLPHSSCLQERKTFSLSLTHSFSSFSLTHKLLSRSRSLFPSFLITHIHTHISLLLLVSPLVENTKCAGKYSLQSQISLLVVSNILFLVLFDWFSYSGTSYPQAFYFCDVIAFMYKEALLNS